MKVPPVRRRHVVGAIAYSGRVPDELIAATADAPWLPAGSTAEVWRTDGTLPEPAIIVRLLLLSEETDRFFCVGTDRGLDLPTLFLGRGERGCDGWDTLADGLVRLTTWVLGRPVETRCIGYVRNVVPNPDDDYRYPTPYAHVPVVVPATPAEPVLAGSWTSLAQGRESLTVRHWWPIVERALTAPGGAR